MSTIIGYIVTAILGWLSSKIHTYFVNKAASDAAAIPVNNAAVAQESATTPGEIDAASKSISSNF